MSNPEWVTVARTVYPHEAHVLAGLLRDSGIDTVIGDDYVNQVFGFASHAFGGVKVRVHPEDEKRAREILQSGGFDTETNGTEP